MELGRMISRLRTDKGLSQRDFAELLGVSNGAVGMWETEKRQPDLDTVKKMAAFFGVSVDYLMGNPQCSTEKKLFFFFFDEKSLIREVFADRIKSAIADKGLNESDFKKNVSIGTERATAFLEGKGEPTANDLIELSQFLDTSIDYLLGQIPKLNKKEKTLLNSFVKLDTDRKDIIIGKTKELLIQQKQFSVAADEPLKKAK